MTAFKSLPTAGVENAVRMRVRGRLGHVEAALVEAAFKTIARLPLESSGTDGEYRSRFTPGSQSFRVMISGTADDTAVQRVSAPLFTAR